MSQKTQERIHFFTYSFYLYGMAALFDLVFAVPGGMTAVFRQDGVFWLCIFYLAVPTTSLATTVYFLASKKLGSHRASSFIFLVPCAALVSSFFIHGEVPSLFTLIGGACAMAAVYLINKYKEQKAKK
jgi:drug/metabolite transporter (DMT)-like permease